MKKSLISSVLFFGLLIGGWVLAQEEMELPDPGLTPDHPFYFLERIFEEIGTFFTFGDLKKAERMAKLAQERMAEAKACAEKGKPEAMKKALAHHAKHLEKARLRTEKAKARGLKVEKVSRIVAEATSKHLAVLDEVLERVPEVARDAILKAKEVSITGHQHALKFLAGEHPEKAMELHLQAVKHRLERARKKIATGEVEKVKEAIGEFEKLRKFGEEISTVAKEAGLDVTKVEQLVGKATSIHLEVLGEVYEKVPEEAKEAIERAMEVSARGHHRAVEALKKMKALEGISEEIPFPKVLPEEIRKRIKTRIMERPELPPVLERPEVPPVKERPEEVPGVAPERPEAPPVKERPEAPSPGPGMP